MSSRAITITLRGEPRGKSRPRAFLKRGAKGLKVGLYTPDDTRNYEAAIRVVAQAEMKLSPALDEPLEMQLVAVFTPPRSWSEKKQQAALRGEVAYDKRPDLDNIVKAWADGLNGVVYRDDALIVRKVAEKRYGPQALVAVTVRPLVRA